MALSPLNQRRWRNFKTNRRAYVSLWLFAILFGLSIFAGEVFGVVGESGSGKTMLTRTVFGLEDSAHLTHGTVSFDGETLPDQGYAKTARRLLGGRIGYVPQDPFSSLNPTMRVGRQITEALYLDLLADAAPVGALYR